MTLIKRVSEQTDCEVLEEMSLPDPVTELVLFEVLLREVLEVALGEWNVCGDSDLVTCEYV